MWSIDAFNDYWAVPFPKSKSWPKSTKARKITCVCYLPAKFPIEKKSRHESIPRKGTFGSHELVFRLVHRSRIALSSVFGNVKKSSLLEITNILGSLINVFGGQLHHRFRTWSQWTSHLRFLLGEPSYATFLIGGRSVTRSPEDIVINKRC